MEDAVCAISDLPAPLDAYALFSVFDGHGGAKVSHRAGLELTDYIVDCASQAHSDSDIAQHALEQALPTFDAKLREDGDGLVGMLPSAASGKPIMSDVKNAYGLMGSTAVVTLLECEGSPAEGRPLRVVVANCGDSRAALCRAGVAVPLTEDHKPDDPIEKARIEAAGGFVAAVGPCQRIDGWGLNLSRALGDFHYKANDDLPHDQQKVVAVPDMRVEEITDEDEFLFLGCDGVFELHSTQAAIDIARGALLEGKPLQQVVEELVDACCSPNLMQTCGHGSDNVSAMIVLLRPDLVS
jgi:serine/threonine protein phosphatase PrpC